MEDQTKITEDVQEVDCSDHPVPSSSSLSTSSAHTGATPVDTNAESIRSEAQQLIEEINAKRTQDTQALADFRKDMELQVSKVCSGLEQHMFGVYDQQSKVMQDKLSDLFSTLDRISVLETELEQFKTALSSLYQEMN